MTQNMHQYKLQLLDFEGTLYKYMVEDFPLLSDPVRYYGITSIYRPFIKGVDAEPGHNNTITEVNYAVERQYCFSTLNGEPYVSVVDTETITITDKFVGFVRYANGYGQFTEACDSHFVAFNTDKRIDKLMEADVYYTTQSYEYHRRPLSTNQAFGDKADKYAYLAAEDGVQYRLETRYLLRPVAHAAVNDCICRFAFVKQFLYRLNFGDKTDEHNDLFPLTFALIEYVLQSVKFGSAYFLRYAALVVPYITARALRQP